MCNKDKPRSTVHERTSFQVVECQGSQRDGPSAPPSEADCYLLTGCDATPLAIRNAGKCACKMAGASSGHFRSMLECAGSREWRGAARVELRDLYQVILSKAMHSCD